VTARRVAIDVKNLALYSGGIAAHSRILIAAWIARRPEVSFSLIGPGFDHSFLRQLSNWRHVEVKWPERLPRPMRHPVYDNLLFPRAVRAANPQVLFTPYHDVRLPRPGSGIRSVMIVHDTCLEDLPDLYPRRVRLYYLAMLRVNLRRAAHVLTDSEASREALVKRYTLARDRLSVVPSAAAADFSPAHVDPAMLRQIRERYQGTRMLFYPSGSDPRKNIARLLRAFQALLADGTQWRLVATGAMDAGWQAHLAGTSPELHRRMDFLGRLDERAVQTYYAAADAVIYPSLCEGFGRLCLEAMCMGAPLACSDLPVLREVAGTYAHYFDPLDPDSIAAAIRDACTGERPAPRRDRRFDVEPVTQSFVSVMDRLCASV
jgi:glycosyltransferase involved in cell wall biosynthesis